MGSEQIGQFLGTLRDAVRSLGWTDLVGWLGLLLVVLLLVHLGRRWVDREVEDVNRRHTLRKWVQYTGGLILIAAALSLLVGRIGQLATVIGLVGAGLAIALQDLGKSVAGWIYLSTRGGFGPGARAEVGGVEGEIIDIGILKTTLLEVGNRVHGLQSSGRLATVPNSLFLNDKAFITPTYAPYSWQELQFIITYESDWERGVEILEEIGRREDEDLGREADRAFHELERRYAFKVGPLTPIVYVTAEDSGVKLTLRHLTPLRERRGARDRITRAMMEAVAREPNLEFAYPTVRFYRKGEEGEEGGRRPPPPSGPPEPEGPRLAGSD